jgi:prepilin-type N-terminal cleavage/methylation domain-containing protein
MRDWKKMNRKGFTLIEIVIAVAIVAIFAAAISPMVFRHLEDAKVSKAQNESETLANALLGYYKDVGSWPVTNADGPSGTAVTRVVSSSVLPSGAAATASTGAAKWSTEGTAKQLGDYLYYNNADDDSSVSGANANEAGQDWPTSGRGAWRGPYVDSYEILDPWGKAYVVNAHYFPSGGYNGSVRHKVFVLSAGPDGKWSTAWDDATTEELKDDDIGTVVTIR